MCDLCCKQQGRVSLRGLRFSPVSIFPSMLHTRLFISHPCNANLLFRGSLSTTLQGSVLKQHRIFFFIKLWWNQSERIFVLNAEYTECAQKKNMFNNVNVWRTLASSKPMLQKKRSRNFSKASSIHLLFLTSFVLYCLSLFLNLWGKVNILCLAMPEASVAAIWLSWLATGNNNENTQRLLTYCTRLP